MRTSFSSCIADSNTGKISSKILYFSQENLKMSIFVQNVKIIFPFRFFWGKFRFILPDFASEDHYAMCEQARVFLHCN